MSPTERVHRALQDNSDDLTLLGSRRAQDHDGGIYVPYPQPHARNDGVEQSTEIDIYRHDPTGAIVVLPPE